MNDCDAWGTLIESVGSVCADWVCLFASEVDAVLDSFETIYGLRHRVISHWHGPGSYAMAVAVNSKYDRLVKSVECMGRGMRVHYRDGARADASFIFTHGGHGDALNHSCADVAALVKSRPKSSEIFIVGDQCGSFTGAGYRSLG